MIFCLNFVLAVSVTGHSRMKCFQFLIPFPHNGQVESTVYWLNFDLFACKVYVPVSILACLLTDRGKMTNLYRGPSIYASYQISVHLGKWFQ